jgi:uncharacterized protein (TIGR03086 family)
MTSSLLADALDYAVGSVACVAPGLLSRPTPCRDWDLAALLRHANDSLAALHEGLARGYVSLDRTGPAPSQQPNGDRAAGDQAAGDQAVSLTAIFRDRAARLLAAAGTGGHDDIAVADRHVAAVIVTAVGAIEIAVHGWDVAAACGHGRSRPIPAELASGVLEIIPLVVTGATRGSQFAAPVSLPPLASPSDRLIALLGRDPAAPGPARGPSRT